ncbi:MAG TPA: lysylphosphatidylglycerol synthase transmembrane domain-containing protein [Dehalococcoidia bacterium]|nr:lysylphosphatidylglycerol synthase transmembrane domain-containing protein [Dehalococcoidia bacterium]
MEERLVKLRIHLSLQAAIWLALLFVAAATIAFNASEVAAIADVLSAARAPYLGVLAVVEVIFILNMGLFYTSTFQASGVPASAWRFTLVSAAAYFVNLVSKTSGFGGLTLYLREGRRHGDPPLKTTAAYMAAYALGYAAFLALLVISLILLYVEGSLTRLDVAASAVLFCLVVAVSTVLMAGLRSEASLERLFLLAIAPVNLVGRRVVGKEVIAPEGLRHSARELHESVHLMLRRPRRFLIPFGHALAIELLSALGLFLVARSLGVPIGFELAVAGYALSLLFAILAVTPAGLGFVEASLAVFLVSVGMSRHEAIAVTLGFRLFDFWLPVAVGALSVLALRLTEAGGE